jgi:hypothetical protein
MSICKYVFREEQMGKRGPKPQGEFSGKTAVISVRLRPETRRRLETEKKASGRSLSQELEWRLRGSFVEDDKAVDFYGSAQNAAILKLLGLVIQAVGTTRLQKRAGKWGPNPAEGDEWLRNPELFDSVCNAIQHTLEWWRPGGAGRALVYNSDSEALLDEIRAANAASPFDKGVTTRQHALAKLRDGLGELAQRPHPHDAWSKAEPHADFVMRADPLVPAKKAVRRKGK